VLEADPMDLSSQASFPSLVDMDGFDSGYSRAVEKMKKRVLHGSRDSVNFNIWSLGSARN